jgi:zinc transport system ATP-binding protein
MPAAPIAALHDVSFAYDGDDAVSGVSLVFPEGEFTALVGPNGSGKSTLLRLLLGLLAPRRGRVELFGTDPRRLTDRSALGFVPQRPSLGQGIGATVEDLVSSGRLSRRGWLRRPGAADRRAIEQALEAVGLAAHRRCRVRELSGGQQQRAFIARALAGDPELLVLDEPIAGVDAEAQKDFRASLAHLVDRGGTVLLVSHELSAVADDLDRIVVVKRSVRFDGTPAELRETGVNLGFHEHDLPIWLEGVGS